MFYIHIFLFIFCLHTVCAVMRIRLRLLLFFTS